MRRSLSSLCCVFLSCLPLYAQSTTRPKTKAADRTREEVRQLREEVGQQKQEIQELKAMLRQVIAENRAAKDAADQAGARAEAAQAAASQAQNAASEASKTADHAEFSAAEAKTSSVLQKDSSAAEERRLGALESLSNRFRFGGDIRVRFEPSFQDPNPARYRARLRVRFGVEGKANEDFTGGFYLATGTVNDDPVSTNFTLSQFFTRKTFGVDRGWVTYRPLAHRWLQLTGGKFAYTWQRTSLTFDPDLNPEGFSEKLSFDLKNPVLKNVSFTGMQLIFNEVAGSNLPASLGNDSFAAGAQASARFQFGPRVSTTFSATALNWRNTDSIIQAIVAKTLAGNRNTNATVGSGAATTYASQFLYADFIADTTVQTWSPRWPLRLALDFVDNPRAASDQAQGFWGETSLGRLQEANDIQFGYAFGRIEQDAVIAAFTESELRAPTNIIEHKLSFLWQARKNAIASFTGWFGRALDPNLPPAPSSGAGENYLKRLQFDMIYKF